MEDLAVLLRVSIVATKHKTRAGEGGLASTGEDWIVHARLSGDGGAQPIQGVITFSGYSSGGEQEEC